MEKLSADFPRLTPVDVKQTPFTFIRMIDQWGDLACVEDGYDMIAHEDMGFIKRLEQPFLIFTGTNWLHNVTAYYVWEVYKKQQDFDLIVFDAHLDLMSAGDHAPDDMIEYHNYMKSLLIAVGKDVNAFNIGSAYNQGSLYRKGDCFKRESPLGFEHTYFVNITLDDILEKSKKKVYVSIDLDCLWGFPTDASSGRMTKKTLQEHATRISHEKELVGVDVCGIQGMYRTKHNGYVSGKEIIPQLLACF